MTVAKAPRRRYDANTVEEICRRLRAGESLLRISKDPKMPSQRTLSDWVARNHLGFAEKYLEAKRISAHFLAEKALDEAYNAADDFYLDDEGRPIFDGNHVQRSKLIIDTIKWEVSKMLPRIYGDKVTQEFGVSGDLAKLLESATNKDTGLPPPIDGDYREVRESDKDSIETAGAFESIGPDAEGRSDENHQTNHYLRGIGSGPATPSNHKAHRRRRRR